MPVRKTETRIPTGLVAGDLGEAFIATDARCALVSYITAPLASGRENRYVVFVTDAGLADQVDTYAWSFSDDGGTATTQTTQVGEAAYSPQGDASVSVTVSLLDTANTEQASLTLTQEVTTPNPVLEATISDAADSPGPGTGNPDVVRELVNDYSPYYQAVKLATPESDDSFLHFLFSIVFDGAQQRTPDQRKQHVDDLVLSLTDEAPDFASLLAQGTGVCGLRLPLLAMTAGVAGAGWTAPLTWTELPDLPAQHDSAEQQLCQAVAALDEDVRIDLFNLARFPKTNITAAGRIVEALRDRYFAGANFSDVLTGMAGTRAQWIVRHYREGPLSHT